MHVETQLVRDSEVPLFEMSHSKSSSHRYVSKGGIYECNIYKSAV